MKENEIQEVVTRLILRLEIILILKDFQGFMVFLHIDHWYNFLRQEVSRQDLLTVGEFGALLDETGMRQEVVSDVTVKLQSEVLLLAEFLGQLSRRRPKC